MNIWNQECYSRVQWDELINDNSHNKSQLIHISETKKLSDRIIDNSLLAIPATAVAKGTEMAISSDFFETIGVIDPIYKNYAAFVAFASVYISSHIVSTKNDRLYEYNRVFPMKQPADLFVGQREPWMKSKDEKISLNDLGSLRSIFEGISHGLSLTSRIKSDRTRLGKIKDDAKVYFDKNLYTSGGPIPNAYSRNLLYGSDIPFPYKFRLDINYNNKYLGDLSPLELKNLVNIKEINPSAESLSYDPALEAKWYICDNNGEKIWDKKSSIDLTPQFEHGKLVIDNFMIIKSKNIHPSAKNINKKSVMFAGCHGPGTEAAGSLLRSNDMVHDIWDKVDDENFQLIGKVSVRQLYEPGQSGKINESSIKIIKIVKESDYPEI